MAVNSFPIYDNVIKKNSGYKYVYSGKNRVHSNNFIIFYRLNNQNARFFGMSISRKTGNSVARSRIRRLIKESLKQTGYLFTNNYSYVFVVKANHNIEIFQDLVEELKYISGKINTKIKDLSLDLKIN